MHSAMHQTLGMRLTGDELEIADPVPSLRNFGKSPRSWLNSRLSDGAIQGWLEEDGHGAHSIMQASAISACGY